MTVVALAIILVSAMMHATWNYQAKRAGSGVAFVWLVAAVSSALYLIPAALYGSYVASSLPPLRTCLIAITGSGLLHIGYFLLLQWGYRDADLSVVYPLARGSAPVWSTAGAFILFHEHPTLHGLLGTALIVGGVLLIAGSGGNHVSGTAPDPERLRRGRLFGLLTGLMIASYTLWDAHGVKQLHVPPLLLDFGSSVFRALVLWPFLNRMRREEAATLWRERRSAVVVVALLCSLAYILILIAMGRFSVSYVAPAREVSIVFGVVLGGRLLGEVNQARRIVGALLIVAGVVALTFG